jgi:ABC-type oligopeptide transport system ATPase subunit
VQSARRRGVALTGKPPEHRAAPRAAANRFPHEFSGGQRQRIGIACALALEPKVLAADKSVSALDLSAQAQVLDSLAGIEAKLRLFLLFVTRDLRVALRICDRISAMRQGGIAEMAPTAEIFAQPRHRYTKALFDAMPGAAGARAWPRRRDRRPPWTCRRTASCPVGASPCRARRTGRSPG